MKTSDTPLISIIVPFYNIKKYLPQCIDSLLNQSYSHIEILLVDDESTDGSAAIADDYATRDQRIRVFHITHSGLSGARNHALDRCCGEYIMFVDGDDFVEPDYCEAALGLIRDYQVEIASFGYNEHWDDQRIVPLSTAHPRLLSHEDALRELITRKDIMYNMVWNKIFHRRVIGDIRFPIGRTYEDIAVMYRWFDRLNTGCYLSDKVLCNYRRFRVGSITSKGNSAQFMSDRLSNELERMEFFKLHYPALVHEQSKQLAHICYLASKLFDRQTPIGHMIKKALSDNKQDVLASLSGTTKAKVLVYYLAYFYFPLLVKAYRRLNKHHSTD